MNKDYLRKINKMHRRYILERIKFVLTSLLLFILTIISVVILVVIINGV